MSSLTFNNCFRTPDRYDRHPAWKPTVRSRLSSALTYEAYCFETYHKAETRSMCELETLEIRDDNGRKLRLVVEERNLLDGTPICDIKPYIPYSDIITEANGGFETLILRLMLNFQMTYLQKLMKSFARPLHKFLSLIKGCL